MHKGELINGYEILQDFTTKGSGLSKWTFARKYGIDYFIKEFLSPTYPVEGSPGSQKTKELKGKMCAEFENHHKRLQDALDDKCSCGGNLVITKEFFRFRSKYYKVTVKIDVTSLSIDDVVKISPENKLLILKTVSHSLRVLHSANIVHGDLKPDNILIKKTETGNFTTKLIDFDNSYFNGEPPNQTEVVGDMVYYSPELGNYVKGECSSPELLTLKSDIFSLGLIFHQYCTGSLPEFDVDKFNYAYVAVNNGEKLKFHDGLSEKIRLLLERMVAKDPADRPGIHTVFNSLKEKDILEPVTPELKTKSMVRGSLAAPDSTPKYENSASEANGKLKGSLLRII